MFWTDAQRGVIERANMDGTGRDVLIDERRSNTNGTSFRPHYYGLGLDEVFLYYTDWTRGLVSSTSSAQKISDSIVK